MVTLCVLPISSTMPVNILISGLATGLCNYEVDFESENSIRESGVTAVMSIVFARVDYWIAGISKKTKDK